MLKRFKYSLVAVAAILLFFLFAPVIIYQNMLAPVSTEPGTVLVEIKSGANSRQIGILLEDANIIRSAKGFIFLAQHRGKSKELKAGEYELDPSKSTPHILSEIVVGKVKLWPVTVPEGFNMREISKIVAAKGFCDEKSFLSSASDPLILDRFGIKGKTAEGYLFPETYHFNKSATPRDIVRKMISTFFKKVAPIKEKYQAPSHLSFEEVITLASIIEKETAIKGEYRLISAVFNNRLKMRMKLQADPTVIYDLPNFDGNIRKKDLTYDSPYNTYVHAGLPPGPIASPGMEAIEAAYNPEDVNYIFFVAKEPRGRHHFSSTYAEHVMAVRKYQLGVK